MVGTAFLLAGAIVCADCMDGVEGAAGEGEVGVEVAAQYSFNWTFWDGLCE